MLSWGDKKLTIKSVSSATNQNSEYAISTSNNATANSLSWQTSTTFRDLKNESYYVYARSQEDDLYSAGTPKQILQLGSRWTYSVTLTTDDAAGTQSANKGLRFITNTGNRPVERCKFDAVTSSGIIVSGGGTVTVGTQAKTFVSDAPWMINSDNGLGLRWYKPAGGAKAYGFSSISLTVSYGNIQITNS